MTINSVTHPLYNPDLIGIIQDYLPANHSRLATISHDLRFALIESQFDVLKNSAPGTYSRKIFDRISQIDPSHDRVVSRIKKIISNCMDRNTFNQWSSARNFPQLIANFNALPVQFFQESFLTAFLNVQNEADPNIIEAYFFLISILVKQNDFHTATYIRDRGLLGVLTKAIQAGNVELIDDLIGHPKFKEIPLRDLKGIPQHLKATHPEYDQTKLIALLKEMREQQSLRR